MKAVILCIFLLFVTTSCFAQSGNETITITTYYPSPHGVYGVLTLYPRTSEPENPREGDMFYNQSDKNIYFYKGPSAGGWQIVGGGESGGNPLVNFNHSQLGCTKAGGEVVDTDTDFKQCRFNLPACPIGWNRYKLYSTTRITQPPQTWPENTCTVEAGGVFVPPCSTTSHAWANMPQETCQCTQGSFDGFNIRCFVGTIYAIITQIGCY